MVLRAGPSWHSVNLLSSSFLKKYLFNSWPCWVFAALQAFSSCCSRGLLSGCRVRASRCRARALGCPGISGCSVHTLEHRLHNCGALGLVSHGSWDLPEPGIKPVSPALQGGFLATEPPGKPNPPLPPAPPAPPLLPSQPACVPEAVLPNGVRPHPSSHSTVLPPPTPAFLLPESVTHPPWSGGDGRHRFPVTCVEPQALGGSFQSFTWRPRGSPTPWSFHLLPAFCRSSAGGRG